MKISNKIIRLYDWKHITGNKKKIVGEILRLYVRAQVTENKKIFKLDFKPMYWEGKNQFGI